MNLKKTFLQFFILTSIMVDVHATELTHLQLLDSDSSEVVLTKRELIKNDITVLINKNNILPVQNLDINKIASVSISEGIITSFTDILDNYTNVDDFVISHNSNKTELKVLNKKLGKYDLVLVVINQIKNSDSKILNSCNAILNKIIENNKVIVVYNGDLSKLNSFSRIEEADALIVSSDNYKLNNNLTSQLIFGAFTTNGKLPFTIDSRFKKGDGLLVENNRSFCYTVPQEAGLDSIKLTTTIDSLMNFALLDSIFPGCQIIVAKDAKIVFHKCYGYHTYDKKLKVQEDDIYDWASVTKTTAPLPALMKLVEEEKINLDARFSNYYKKFKNSNKENIIFREVLAHQAQLIPYIKFWEMGVNTDGTLNDKVFRKKYSRRYSIRVSDSIYMNKKFKKVMMEAIVNSELLPEHKYKYSGLSFLLYPEMITRMTGIPYEQYLKQTFYKPLGANTVTFNAYKYFDKKRLIPTENDTYFRHQLMQGFVHDESAAMMGGISGNAGLFGSALDLAKIYQMYLQKGYYGGRRYLSEYVVNEFTKVQFPYNENKRGLGFDKPLIDNDKMSLEEAYPAVKASKSSFGHSGFTGTFVWADPESGILFVLMSNRVYPTRDNRKLYDSKLRVMIHEAIYDSLLR